MVRKNKFTKALRHIKSTEIDEKIAVLEAAPTNSLSGVYSKSPAGQRLGPIDPAKVFYPDNMQDFSEASLGGLFLDMAAYVGDTMAFYLDHQFRELDPKTVVESSPLSNVTTLPF